MRRWAWMLLVLAAACAACTEGKTPDCADPNVHCGPDVDAAADAAADADADADAAAAADADAAADAAPASPTDASDAG